MITFFENKSPVYNCEICCYETRNKKDYSKHLLTRKHLNIEKMVTNGNTLTQKSPNDYSCEDCGLSYKYKSGLSRHKKECFKEAQVSNENLSSTNFLDLLKQNQEFKELIAEQNKIILELAKKSAGPTNITNNNNNGTINNNKFNLQVFLNEKCKDALNISEFVDTLNLSLADLENVGESGFVNGISKILIKGLRNLDVYKRPIHCSDLKRETMYLKEQNVWEKDNENKDKLKKAVKLIVHKNMLKVHDWKKVHPDYKDSDSKKNDQYLKILVSSAGPYKKEEEEVSINKIIKNIAREVTIDKNS